MDKLAQLMVTRLIKIRESLVLYKTCVPNTALYNLLGGKDKWKMRIKELEAQEKKIREVLRNNETYR